MDDRDGETPRLSGRKGTQWAARLHGSENPSIQNRLLDPSWYVRGRSKEIYAAGYR